MGGKNRNSLWKVLNWKIGIKSFMEKMKKLQLLKKFSVGKLALKFRIVGENILIRKMPWKVVIG